jgi:hypothetical protein
MGLRSRALAASLLIAPGTAAASAAADEAAAGGHWVHAYAF